MRTAYEQVLLETRQGLKDAEEALRKEPCVSLSVFKEVMRYKLIIHTELVNYRSGSKNENRDLMKYIEG